MQEKINVIIVDDEPLGCRRIGRMLKDFPDVQVHAVCYDSRSALEAIQTHKPDLLFLDIQMPGSSGFELLRQIPSGLLPDVIFVTAYDSYAVQAFEIHAIDYVLKPIDKSRLTAAMERARELIRLRQQRGVNSQILNLLQDLKMRDNHIQRIPVRAEGKVLIVNVEKIDWIESEGKYVWLYCGSQKHMIRRAIHKMERELDPRKFLRIHRKIIVNLESILELQSLFHGEYQVVLRNGTALKLSRKFRPRLKSLFGDH